MSRAAILEKLQTAITDWLTLLVELGSVVELRALGVRRKFGNPITATGFYDSDHLAEMARDAIKLDSKSRGVYFTLNPLHRDLLSRCANRVDVAKRGESTSAEHVLRRRWLLIDCDPVRTSGISSNEAELEYAEQVAHDVDVFLFDQGWPGAIRALSGNGYHWLYRIDLPTDDGELVKRVLKSLSAKFSTERAKIDTAVFDPPRICKLYGTYARKGDSTAERPHRLSRILDIPDELRIVTREQLEYVAAMMPATPTAPASRTNATPVTSAKSSSTNVADRARNYLAKLPPAVSGQGGSNATYHAASVLMKGFALSIDDALPLLSEWNLRCSPPWTEPELLHKLSDAEKAPGEVGNMLRSDFTSPASTSAATPKPIEQRPTSILPAGTLVRAKDRDNFGHVVSDDGGELVKVHFVSPSGDEATVELRREQLAFADGSSVVPTGFQLKLITSDEFAQADFRQHFLVKRLLVEEQCCILGGPKKVLKTSLLCDLAFSLGTGTPFLSHPDFHVPEPVNVAMLSGESGGFTLRETAKRIALERGRILQSASVWWGFDLPQLGEAEHLKVLADQIERHSIKVVIIDPAYLCLLSAGASANITANVFAMGQLLKGLSEVGRRTGCTLIIAHHTRKADRQSPFGVPDLEDLSGSGFAEWARQWILLNRREPYQSNGQHALWLTVGGSAGHSGTWALDIDEGLMDDGFQGRTWRPKLTPAADAVAHSKRAKEESKLQRDAEKLEKRCQVIRDALAHVQEPMTKSQIRGLTSLSGETFNPPFARLIELGEIRQAGFHPRSKAATFLLVDDAGQVGQVGQNPMSVPPVRGSSDHVGQLFPLIGGECPSCPTRPSGEEAKSSGRTKAVPLPLFNESANVPQEKNSA